jgi:hypothetical protein
LAQSPQKASKGTLMRIVISTITGVILAVLVSVGIVQAATTKPDPVPRPLYNYGTHGQ